MQHTVPGEPILTSSSALLLSLIHDAQSLVPDWAAHNMLGVIDLYLLWVIDDLVLASFFVFLLNHDKHWALRLFKVGLAPDS